MSLALIEVICKFNQVAYRCTNKQAIEAYFMMSISNLIVEGVPSSRQNRLYHHGLTTAGSHPLHFGAIHYLNPRTIASSSSNPLMSATTFSEPPNFLKTSEFLRPLPKPAPVVANRYNEGTNTLNGTSKSWVPESQASTNLVNQMKESSFSDIQASYAMYSAASMYQPDLQSCSHYGSPSIQSGPYSAFYQSNPFTPIMQHDKKAAPLLQLERYPDPSNSMLKSGCSFSGYCNTLVKSIYESSVVSVAMPESAHRGNKRPFKVPPSIEQPLLQKILPRREARVQNNGLGSNIGRLTISSKISSPSSVNDRMSLREFTYPNSPAESKAAVVTSSVNGLSGKKKCNSTLHNFTKGSLIQLANGELKKVEDMQEEDFLSSAEKSSTVRINPSTVVRIQVNVDQHGLSILTLSYNERHLINYKTVVEHPYFVFKHGWSSCSPEKTLKKYGLYCRQLQVGDVCVSLSPKFSDTDDKSEAQKKNSVTSKPQQQKHSKQNKQQLHEDVKVFTNAKKDLKVNSNDINDLHNSREVDADNSNSSLIKHNNFRVGLNLFNHHGAVKMDDNDSNNNSKNASDDGDPGFLHRKRRRWSAPDKINEEYEQSPISSPTSSTSSVLSSTSSVCSTVGVSQND